jgi:RNA polymerase sigma-70 factor, ECF subfamily
MDDTDWLAGRFEEHRGHLRAVAYRMLGSSTEAEDAVQETWIRLSRADTSDVENLGGWLTTVTARVCLNMLQSRRTRREDPVADDFPERVDTVDPEREAVMADSVGLALLVVLDQLAPAERLAFVLHDMFAVPFDDIAAIVGRSPAAARQLASRARRRVQGASAAPDPDAVRRRQVVEAFLAASRSGEFEALLALLDPDVVLRADAAAVLAGAAGEVRGASDVAGTFAGRARAARAMLIDGMPGLVWSQGGKPSMVFHFTITDGRVVAIDLVADASHLDQLDVSPFD